MIRVENVSRNYGSFKAVADVSFEIQQGEIVGLLGHNGAGKTTIMKMLTGYLEPDAGRVLIDGIDVEQERIAAQRKIGYLPENAPLYGDMSVLQYLDYVADLRAISMSKRAKRIREVVELTALGEKAQSRIETLSKGYKQRVGVAQAIIHEPDFLILDEPTNGLDPSQIHEMRGLVRDLSAHATVILSTHILQEVQATCDRVLIMVQGKLAKDAKLDELQSSNRLLIKVEADEKEVCSTLQQVKGVAAIQYLGNGGPAKEYAISLENGEATCAPELAKQIVTAGWPLHGLEAEQRNLESVFREINLGENNVK